MRARLLVPKVAALGLLILVAAAAADAGDVAAVPLWDGETLDPPAASPNPYFNRFGGLPTDRRLLSVTHTTTVSHTGLGSFRLDTDPAIPGGDYGFLSVALTGFSGAPVVYSDARDLSRFDEVAFWLRNDTGKPFTLKLEMKDYRNDIAHRATRSWALSADASWTRYVGPLRLPLDASWRVEGAFDLTRARVLSFVLEANQGGVPPPPVAGAVHLDDLVLVEPGGPVDPATAPVLGLVDRLARRQFDALWRQRDRQTGLVPSHSTFADLAGTNVLAALIQLLPEAIRQGWLPRTEADAFVGLAVATLRAVMDLPEVVHVPPRYLDRVSLAPLPLREESSVDAAFLFLALYQYLNQAETGAPLNTTIPELLARFDFAAFGSPSGWRLAYRHDVSCGVGQPPPCFTPQTYDGYSGEPWLVSLAAHLAGDVDIRTPYHSGVMRVRDPMPGRSRELVVHTMPAFRPPFVQWLLSLFVRTDDRGLDTFPNPLLATNPHANAVAYQREAHGHAATLGRSTHLQPDAGADCSTDAYEQYSFFEDAGQPGLFMPWSVAFSFLGDPAAAEAALRSHLARGWHGPLGLSDAVNWPTGEARPRCVRAAADFWNLALSTLALVQYRFGANERLAGLPAVRSALALVFHGQGFHTLPPCRVLDTRSGDPLVSDVARRIPIAGSCALPPTARAVALNVTAVSATGPGHVTLYPGLHLPTVSTLNFATGQTRANNAVIPLPADETGALNARAAVVGPGQVHLLIDVHGYFE